MSSKFFSSANTNTQSQLVTWINEAGFAEGRKKADILRKIIEVLLHQASQSLPTYVDNILSWSNDKSPEVKKQVIFFIEELSKVHPELFPEHHLVTQLRLILEDSVIAVQKRAIQAASIVYRHSLLWICKGTSPIADQKAVWEQITELKLSILNMIDSDNEGIRTHSIKFLEEVVLLQTYSDSDNADFSLDNLPATLPFINKKALEEESEHIFTLLLKFHNSQHISSVNLMACMTSLCSLAKFRPKYLTHVIEALADLHTTLPPTLTQSQVNSVRKHLRAQLIGLLKSPSTSEQFPQITQLLLDSGMTPQELTKVIPKERRGKRLGDAKFGEGVAKRMKLDSPQNSQGSDSNSRSDFNVIEETVSEPPKVNVTEETIFDGLNSTEAVVALVMKTLHHNLPDSMPIGFANNYKPIPNAGSVAQKKTLAKMIINVIKGENPIPQPVLPPVAAKIPLLRDDDEKIALKNAVAKLQESSNKLESEKNRIMEDKRQEFIMEARETAEKQAPPPTPTINKLKQKVRLLKLQEITRPIPKEVKERLMIQSVARILNAETESAIGGAAQVRAKLITTFASSYTPELRELVMNYILEEPVKRIDLALGWLYEEFALMQGFNRLPVTLYPKMNNEKHDQSYNNLLCALVTQICERGDPASESSKDFLLRRIYLEAPLVTEEAIDYLKHLVSEVNMSIVPLELLEEICMMRLPRAHKCIPALLCHTLNEVKEIRETSLKSVLKIYKLCPSESVVKVIEKYAKLYLGFIALNSPPGDLFNPESMRPHLWSDDLYKICLNLIMTLFTVNEDLIMDVATVYGQANADAKRCVLRCIEAPVRQVATSPPRPAFLRLLEDCPRGAETLLTRLVHILTEKSPPTAALVSRVRDLYASRVSDVRFLIPVINGLTKKEILAALPKLIKLNPAVVKEVFNKLLGLQANGDENLPVTPSELLIALHLIDPAKADLKYTIKATALCFAEKQTYTQEVVSGVLQYLVEQEDIPVLFMRSVLQALAIYPQISGFVLNLLQRLIEKEVWCHKVAWEGWIKCCERTLPASCSIIVQLPAAAYIACLTNAPAVVTSLKTYLASLPPNHRDRLPPHVVLQFTAFNAKNQFSEPLPPGME